jgi:hypothetical protein
MTQCSISADTDHDLELPDQVYVCKEVRKFRPSRMKQSLLPGTRSRGGYEIFEVSLQPFVAEKLLKLRVHHHMIVTHQSPCEVQRRPFPWESNLQGEG